jgi:hypothetical protein
VFTNRISALLASWLSPSIHRRRPDAAPSGPARVNASTRSPPAPAGPGPGMGGEQRAGLHVTGTRLARTRHPIVPRPARAYSYVAPPEKKAELWALVDAIQAALDEELYPDGCLTPGT